MKKILFYSLSASLVFCSCSKDDNEPTPGAISYLSVTPGQTRTFENKDSISGTINTTVQISSSRDTTVGSRTYHAFDNSDGTTEYFAVSGNDYYTLFNLPATISTAPIELLYLKSNAGVGTSWAQNFSFNIPGAPFPIPITFTHTIKEKGISKTTGAINHTDVIRVETKVSSAFLNINSDIQTYCAPKYGVVHLITYIEETTAGVEIHTRRTMIGANF